MKWEHIQLADGHGPIERLDVETGYIYNVGPRDNETYIFVPKPNLLNAPTLSFTSGPKALFDALAALESDGGHVFCANDAPADRNGCSTCQSITSTLGRPYGCVALGIADRARRG